MRTKKRRKRGRKGLPLLLLILLLAGYLLEEQIWEEDGGQLASQAAEVIQDGSSLEVHYIDVGQGDATLILCDGHAMLIDAGNNNKGTAVQSYLISQGVETLDYVIGTHPDADHIGGLDVVLYKFDCRTVIMPDYSRDTKTYDDVIQTMKNQNYQNTLPVVGTVYELGSAAFTIVAPNGTYGSNTNDYSVAILLRHGENRFLFTGDAEEASEEDMQKNGIDLSADVYKAAHHGSSTANTEAFLEAVSPTYAVISCGEDNSYGHPHAEVLNRFRAMGIQVFRTDEQGTIVAYSDGKEVTFNMSPSESWQVGEPRQSDRE
jgi:competence protein ComEC